MPTATATKITYRKTKTGEWVAYGPAADMPIAGLVTVTKKSGDTKTETVERLGRPFTVDGVEMVYAYPAPSRRASTPAPAGRTHRNHGGGCKTGDGDCWSLGVTGCRECSS